MSSCGMSRSVRAALIGSLLVCVFLSLTAWQRPDVASKVRKLWPERLTGRPRHCPTGKNADDIYLSFRTGATEIEAKLLAHTTSSFACPREYTIFSDNEETLYGEQVHNVLDYVSEDIRKNNPDFELYRRLKHGGRAALNRSELADGLALMDPSGMGHTDNPGWKLDKWKFLPMVNATYHLAPDYKWYFFMEADTSVFWTTLLRYTEELDPNRATYIGSEHWLGSDEFAHGGSGFLVSNPALKRVVELYSENKDKWEYTVDKQWAGDFVLAQAFKQAGISLTHAGGMFRPHHPGAAVFSGNDRRDIPMWCLPSLTWHHVAADMLPQLHEFEEPWLDSRKGAYPRYRDVFTDFVMPQMKHPKDKWDNGSSDLEEVQDPKACEELCREDPECVQFSFDRERKECRTSMDPQLGQADPRRAAVYSDWIYDRVVKWQQDHSECKGDLFQTPE